MPIYVYKCDKCGAVKEKLMKHTDPAPECDTLTQTKEEAVFSKSHGLMTKQLTGTHKFCQAEGTVGGFSSGTLLV